MGLHKIKLPVTLSITILLVTAMLMVSAFSTQVSAQTTESIVINNGAEYTNSTEVTLKLNSNSDFMQFSNDNSTWSEWEAYGATKTWTLPAEEDAPYTIYVQFSNATDTSEEITNLAADIFLDVTPPVIVREVGYYTVDCRTIFCDASQSGDNVDIASYTWDFGDGNTTTGMFVFHTYVPGNYTITLTVKDLAGNNATTYLQMFIPDLAMPTTSVPTVVPTPNRTTDPPATLQPSITPPPASTPTDFDSDLAIIIVAVIIIVVGGVAIVLLLRKPK